ncbi:MAG: hypothetical protein CMH57_02785 [Myxococcales bacterium]|nr:hypothetical protein [Myxococcales bacterium]
MPTGYLGHLPPVRLPALQSGVTFGTAASALSYQLTNNDQANPCGLQLAFNPAYLEADEDTQDDGTVAAPCYVIEPGGSRAISLVRSDTCPDSGGPYPVTVTATLAGGTVVVGSISVEPPSDVPSLLAALSPSLLYDFRTVSPVAGFGSGDLTLQNGASLVAPAEGSGFLGELFIAGAAQDAYFSQIANTMNRTAGQDRSLVWAGRLGPDNNDSRIITDCATVGRYIGSIGDTGGGFLQIGNDGYDPNDYSLHLASKSTEELGPYLICIAWDASENDYVISALGPGDGGSWTQQTQAVGAQTGDPNPRTYYLGGISASARIAHHGAYAIYDTFIDAPTDLAGVAAAMGIGS